MLKKCAIAAFMLALTLNSSGVLAADEVNVSVDQGTTVNVNVHQNKVTNWDKAESGEIVEVGIGVINPEFSGAQAEVMARRAAMIDCYRNLLQRVKNLNVDANSDMLNYMGKNDVVATKINGAITGARIIEEWEEGSGAGYKYYVKMVMPLFGNNSVAAAALPEIMKDTPRAEPPAVVTAKTTVMPKKEFQAVQKEIKSVGYTGIVIDASGMGLESTMAPQILDINGRAIYGKENIDVDFAVIHGLVEYSRDLTAATSGATRAGKNPLVLKAIGVKDGSNSVNPVNVIVSPEDADKILLAAQNNLELFPKGAIVFVR